MVARYARFPRERRVGSRTVKLGSRERTRRLHGLDGGRDAGGSQQHHHQLGAITQRTRAGPQRRCAAPAQVGSQLGGSVSRYRSPTVV